MQQQPFQESHSGPLLIGLPGRELDAAGRAQLCHPWVGGVVLFSRNFGDRAQFERLVADIRSACDPRPLLCIDQEGGRVQRLRESFTRLPPLGALGRLYEDDPVKALDLAYRHGRVMATEMLEVGVDLSFAPVLDLDRGSSVIGDRAFSADPAIVQALGGCYLSGMHDAGMRTTGKHFPGHGSVVADSHVADVSDPRSLADIEASDLLPFAGLAGQLDALMIAHVVYPQVDAMPAGYSRRWLHGILRQHMGYDGVILSDDLGMHAARAVGDLPVRTRRCLDAGCDLVLVCQPDDVRALLTDLQAPAPDAGAAVSRLLGTPTLDRGQLAEVAREGIREWAQWQRSLEALSAASPA